MMEWYALYTKYNCEQQVKHVLAERDIETYLPLIPSSQPGKQGRLVPLLPCYLFVHVDLAVVGLSQLIWTPGLRSLVAFDKQPAIIPPTWIDQIEQRLVAGAYQPQHAFQPGDAVEVTSGPLAGMSAIFSGNLKGSERVEIFLTFLGQMRKVNVEAASLKQGDAAEDVTTGYLKRPRRTRGRGRKVKRHN